MTDRLHLCVTCCTAWVKSGEYRCPDCAPGQPTRKPIPIYTPGSAPPADLGITE
jgi:hypothetical protein